jgi:hypothetical protein
MSGLETELRELIETFNLKESAFDALENIKMGHIKSGELIDGYSFTEFEFLFERFEIRIKTEDNISTIIAKINILESNSKIPNEKGKDVVGYYDYIVDFKGNFIDEFFVLKRIKTLANKG